MCLPCESLSKKEQWTVLALLPGFRLTPSHLCNIKNATTAGNTGYSSIVILRTQFNDPHLPLYLTLPGVI